MTTRPKKKLTAKKPEAKPVLPDASEQKPLHIEALRVLGFQLPRAMADLKAEAERYHRPVEDRRMLTVWDRPQTQRDDPKTQPATAQPSPANPPEYELSTKVRLTLACGQHPKQQGELMAPYARRLHKLMPGVSVSWKTLLRLLFELR